MIINNANLVTFWSNEPLVEGALVAVEGKTVVDFGKVGKLVDRYDDPDVLDVAGRFVLPGLVNAHDRLYLRFAPGMPTHGIRPKTARDLRGERLRIEDALDEEALYWSAVVGLLDALRSGVTTVFAFDSSPMHVEGSLAVLARAFQEVRARGALAYAISPRSHPEVALQENLRHLDACRERPSEFLRGLVGLEATTELPDGLLAEAAEVGAPVQLVLSEDDEEVDESLSRHGTTPARRLERAGLLRRGGIVLQGGELRREDEAALAATELFLAHAPQSAAVGGVAAPDLMRAATAGLAMGLGTDGAGSSILEEFRMAALRQRARGHDLADAIRLGYRAAFAGNAELASRVFEVPLGVLKPGARADLVVLDCWPTTPVDPENLPEHLFWEIARAPVHSVIVNGTIVISQSTFRDPRRRTAPGARSGSRESHVGANLKHDLQDVSWSSRPPLPRRLWPRQHPSRRTR